MSVIFDGTSHLGEALAIIVRFVTGDWRIEQRLIRMQLLAKSLTGEEIARELISVLQALYEISVGGLLAAMHDRASNNTVAMSTVKVLYPDILDVGCFSHTLDHVGETFSTPTLNEFVTNWLTLFAHSPKARLAWKSRTGKSVKSYSKTRWWSRWEVIEQMFVMFGDILLFLEDNSDLGPATHTKTLPILHNPQKKAALMLEMAITVDAGKIFVQTTNNLEGNRLLVLDCFEKLEAVSKSIQVKYYPNTKALIACLTSGPGQPPHMAQQWLQYAQSCMQPGFEYYQDRFTGSLGLMVAAFKAARLFSPTKIGLLHPDATSVDNLRAFPFLHDEDLSGLKEKLPNYPAKASDDAPDVVLLEWWKHHEQDLPKWASALHKVLLVQPSSASAEQVFSPHVYFFRKPTGQLS